MNKLPQAGGRQVVGFALLSLLFSETSNASEVVHSLQNGRALAVVHAGEGVIVRSGNRVLASHGLSLGHQLTSIASLQGGFVPAGEQSSSLGTSSSFFRPK